MTKPDLLTPHNCQLIFIDHQPQMAFGVQSIDRQTLKNNTVALAKSAKVFGIPVTITTVETESFSGHTYPELLAVFPEHPLLERTSMNSWDDQKVSDALKKNGQKKVGRLRAVDRGLQQQLRFLGDERRRLRDLHGGRRFRRNDEAGA
jgi:nicotinamidase-related amidase